MSLPPRGALAVDSDVDGRLAALEPDTPRPIASVAKAMTALVVLQARPLAADQEGPVLTITQADVDDYRTSLAADGSTLPVTVGERLTERQLLLGLMLPSANNIAATLARWIDGSAGAFVARLNSAATALGMAHSHFDDASGFSPQTTSSPADLVRLARAVLAQPSLAAIVSTKSAILPDGTELHTLDSLLLSEPGWLGIKTGSTPQAGGCLLFAARRPVGGSATAVTVMGAVLGQTDRGAALQAAKHAVDSAFAGYVPVDLSALPIPVEGRITAAWGSNSGLELARAPSSTVELRQGTYITLTVTPDHPQAPVSAGTRAATLIISARDRVLGRRDLVASRAVPGPGIVWRLVHG